MAEFFRIILILLFCGAAVTAAPEISDRNYQYLPEILLEYNGKKINRLEGLKILSRIEPDFDKLKQGELQELLQKTLEEYIYFEISSDFLQSRGVEVSYDKTLKYLRDSEKQLPPELKKIKYADQNFVKIASDKNFQLTVAILEYLKKEHPTLAHVTPEEIETFYRNNQNIFMHEAKLEVAFIAVLKKNPDAKKIINQAYDRLCQHENFEKLAEEINQALPLTFYKEALTPELLRQGAALNRGEYSGIIELNDRYTILQLKQKERPGYLTIPESEFFIRSILESKKCAPELEKIINSALKKSAVNYYF